MKATAIGSHGQRVSLTEAGPDTVIDLGGDLGSTKASVWEGMGYIERDPSGRGYRVVGSSAPSAAATPPVAPPQPPVVKPAEVNPADVAGVPPTSAQADAFQQSMKPAVVECRLPRSFLGAPRRPRGPAAGNRVWTGWALARGVPAYREG